jgi:hypothetical protein
MLPPDEAEYFKNPRMFEVADLPSDLAVRLIQQPAAKPAALPTRPASLPPAIPQPQQRPPLTRLGALLAAGPVLSAPPPARPTKPNKQKRKHAVIPGYYECDDPALRQLIEDVRAGKRLPPCDGMMTAAGVLAAADLRRGKSRPGGELPPEQPAKVRPWTAEEVVAAAAKARALATGKAPREVEMIAGPPQGGKRWSAAEIIAAGEKRRALPRA